MLTCCFTGGCAAVERIRDVDVLHAQQRNVGWGLGASKLEQLSKLATSSDLVRLYQLLLFTLPGTPVFTYGDEIGLQAGDVSFENNRLFIRFDNFIARYNLFIVSISG